MAQENLTLSLRAIKLRIGIRFPELIVGFNKDLRAPLEHTEVVVYCRAERHDVMPRGLGFRTNCKPFRTDNGSMIRQGAYLRRDLAGAEDSWSSPRCIYMRMNFISRDIRTKQHSCATHVTYSLLLRVTRRSGSLPRRPMSKIFAMSAERERVVENACKVHT